MQYIDRRINIIINKTFYTNYKLQLQIIITDGFESGRLLKRNCFNFYLNFILIILI